MWHAKRLSQLGISLEELQCRSSDSHASERESMKSSKSSKNCSSISSKNQLLKHFVKPLHLLCCIWRMFVLKATLQNTTERRYAVCQAATRSMALEIGPGHMEFCQNDSDLHKTTQKTRDWGKKQTNTQYMQVSFVLHKLLTKVAPMCFQQQQQKQSQSLKNTKFSCRFFFHRPNSGIKSSITSTNSTSGLLWIPVRQVSL